jgi:hypothetical protein
MAATTAAQFARQLRRLGATVTLPDGRTVTAHYRRVEVTSRFRPDTDAFDVAYRTDDGRGVPAAVGAEPIRSMAAVRRVLGLPKQPVLTLGTTGRRNSRVHILCPGWLTIAECGVSLRWPHTEGTPREVTCRRCRSIWRQR